jgi:hypothetical protein
MAYALCSASMLIVNKWALIHFPLPAMLTFLQCGSTALVIVLARATGAQQTDAVSWGDIYRFLSVPFLFALALYSSSQLLRASDAGLQILVRTTTPVAVCIADRLFMGYELPSLRSSVALLGLVVGAAFYFRVEADITPLAIFWGALYFVSISTEMVWVKHVLDSVRMSTWTRVLLTNLVTVFFMGPLCLVRPEYVAPRRSPRTERAGAAHPAARTTPPTELNPTRIAPRARRATKARRAGELSDGRDTAHTDRRARGQRLVRRWLRHFVQRLQAARDGIGDDIHLCRSRVQVCDRARKPADLGAPRELARRGGAVRLDRPLHHLRRAQEARGRQADDPDAGALRFDDERETAAAARHQAR